MRRWILLIIAVLCVSVVSGLEFCEDTPQIHTNCTMLTNVVYCEVYNYSVYNVSGNQVENGVLDEFADGVYYFNFTLGSGEYVIKLCSGAVREVEVVEGGGMGVIAAIIFLPLVFGVFSLAGAVSLNGEEHGALKIFLYLLSLVTVWVSFHFGMVSVVKYYDFPELQNLIGTTTYWVGLVFFVLLSYFLIYTFIKAVQVAAQKKRERLEY